MPRKAPGEPRLIDTYADNLGDGQYRCRECGYTGSRGSVQLHHHYAHNGGSHSAPARSPRKPAGCAHSYRILSGRRPREARAIAAGHRKVCTKCGDLQ